jgi:transposase
MSEQQRGLTVAEAAKLLRVGRGTVRSWIRRGQLGAINTAPPLAKPRFVVLPHHLAEFERAHQASTPTPPTRRKRRTYAVDYYPD